MTQFVRSPGFHHYDLVVKADTYDTYTYPDITENNILFHDGVLEVRTPSMTQVFPISSLCQFDVKLRCYEKDGKTYYPDGRPIGRQTQ